MLLCGQEGVHRCWSVVLKLIIRVAGPGIFSLTSVAQPPTTKAFSAGVWALCTQLRPCGPEVLEISMPPFTSQRKIHENWWIKALSPRSLVWDTSEVHVLRCLLVSWQLDEAPGPKKRQEASIVPLGLAGRNRSSTSETLPASFQPLWISFNSWSTLSLALSQGLCPCCFPSPGCPLHFIAYSFFYQFKNLFFMGDWHSCLDWFPLLYTSYPLIFIVLI